MTLSSPTPWQSYYIHYQIRYLLPWSCAIQDKTIYKCYKNKKSGTMTPWSSVRWDRPCWKSLLPIKDYRKWYLLSLKLWGCDCCCQPLNSIRLLRPRSVRKIFACCLSLIGCTRLEKQPWINTATLGVNSPTNNPGRRKHKNPLEFFLFLGASSLN